MAGLFKAERTKNMKRILHLPVAPHRIPSIKLLPLVITIGLSFGDAAVALAGYIPPVNSEPPSGSSSTDGVRGCFSRDREINVGLVALAPQSRVGQTISTRPTFVWYVPDTESFAMELLLYKLMPNNQYELEHKAQLQSAQGFMSYTLPEDVLELAVGERYVWQVVQICDPDDLSNAVASGAEFEVVSPPANLADMPTDDRVEQANRYAEAGFWYDALALVSVSPVDPSAEAFRGQLLTDLAELEAAYEQMSDLQVVPYSQQLKQLIVLP